MVKGGAVASRPNGSTVIVCGLTWERDDGAFWLMAVDWRR